MKLLKLIRRWLRLETKERPKVAITAGVPVIWGVQEPKPINNLPFGYLRLRLRMRNNDFAKAFIKFSDRVEQWCVGPASGTAKDCSEWRLLWKQGENRIA